jgi:hypothetical protein
MPETLFIRDFSGGWTPSDDPINGRPNGLLQMDNLELDKNGALTLIGGTQIVQSGFPANAHTMYSRYISGIRHDYVALVNGDVWRDGAQILSGGDSQNAAFDTAYNFTIICSGSKRVKDSGSAVVNLGILPPTLSPTITSSQSNAPWQVVGPYMSSISQVWGSSSFGSYYVQIVTDSSTGTGGIQTDPGSLHDCTILSSVAGSGTATDDDFIVLSGYIANPYGVSLQFDVLLVNPPPLGAQVSDYYSYVVADLAQQAEFDSVTGVFTLRMKRSDFYKQGGGSYDWSTVWGFKVWVDLHRISSEAINIWSFTGQSSFVIQGGSIAQFGTYEYVQMNVNNTGSYLAKSILGPISKPRDLFGLCGLISAQDPAGVDPQCNEAWIFRRGGTLEQWYRVMVLNSSTGYTNKYDTFSDSQAQAVNITVNLNLVSIASITDKIFDIVGPIQGRWYYFTTNFMYPSDQNNPDLVDTSRSLRTCGSASEMHMWARGISASVVIIGTTVDMYLLTGTFTTFPDGSIDIYYQDLNVKYPPITYDAVAYGGAVYYLANDGWRMIMATSFGTTYANQNNQLIVAPNTDRLYRNESCYGYAGINLKIPPGTLRFPVIVAKNKLWCFIWGTGRCEVYDFMRQYWRTFNYNLGDVGAAFSTQDGQVLAFYTNDGKTREIGLQGSKLIDGVNQQSFSLLTGFKDEGKPRQRKDTYTLKSRIYTGLGSCNVDVTNEKGVKSLFPSSLTSHSISTEVFLDASLNSVPNMDLSKAFQFHLYGQTNDLTIEDVSLDFDSRPVPLTFLRIYPSNFGSPTAKRLRTWPIVIDTLGKDVTFTPDIDGLAAPTSIFNTSSKRTVYHYFTTDVFGTDYGGMLYDPAGLMEVWSVLGQDSGPEIVQNLPIPKKFDQVGPLELFRFSKIVQIELRVLSDGGPQIPFTIYFSDYSILSGSFVVAPGKDDSYFIDVPKGTNGRILRVEIGPTAFTFHRFYMRFQVAISGDQPNTELTWITLPGQMLGGGGQ